VSRSRDRDACPGALQLHQAADGALARIRLPAGMITAAQLRALAGIAVKFGAPAMELTSRGNIQIRAITNTAAVADAVAAAGLLPSPTHERVRNIVASPLSGRVAGHADVRGWVGQLDRAIRGEPALAALPGRFWFGIDDGRGDVSGLGADVGAHLLDPSTAALVLAGRDTGVRLRPEDVVTTLIAVAARFAALRGTAWRVGELTEVDGLLGNLGPTAEPGARWVGATRPPVGWIEQDDGRVALGAAVPLGVLAARVGEYVAAIGSPLVVTPWRSVLVFDLDPPIAEAAVRGLAPLGLVFDENSPWLGVSACTGSPGCQHSAAGAGDIHRHFVGCERACGSPPAGEVLVATGHGYRRVRSHPQGEVAPTG
jgi:precorrin-3B synthase